jgi:transposase
VTSASEISRRRPVEQGRRSRQGLARTRPPSPDLNPAEGVWANMKNGLGNLAARNVDQLAAVVRNRLKRIQYRPALIGFLAQTGLTLEPEPP